MGFEESISSLIENAKEEKNNILEKIEYILNCRFVELLKDSQEIVQSYNKIKEMLELEINLENTMAEFLNNNSKKLISLLGIISKLQIREDNLMNEVEECIGSAQSLLEKMELAIEEAKTNLLKSLENQIMVEYKNKNKLNKGKNIIVEEVADVEELEIIDEDKKQEIKMEIEEIEMEHGKGQKIIVEDVEAVEEKQGIIVEDLENTENAIVPVNEVKKSFFARIKAKLSGEKITVTKIKEKEIEEKIK